jgi:hypothetical protein
MLSLLTKTLQVVPMLAVTFAASRWGADSNANCSRAFT